MINYILLLSIICGLSTAEEYCKSTTTSKIQREGGVYTEVYCEDVEIKKGEQLKLALDPQASPDKILFLHLVRVTGHINEKTLEPFKNLMFVSIVDSHVNGLKLKTDAGLSLQIINSTLPKITSDQFEGSQKFSVVVFNSNPGLEFADGAFKNFKQLTQLRVINQTVQHLRKGFFDGLDGVKKLILNADGITEIDENAFSGLDQLKVLELDDNPIQSFKPNTFAKVGVEKLSLINTNVKDDVFEALLPLADHLKEISLPTRIWLNADLEKLNEQFKAIITIGIEENDMGCPGVEQILHKATALGARVIGIPEENSEHIGLIRPKFC